MAFVIDVVQRVADGAGVVDNKRRPADAKLLVAIDFLGLSYTVLLADDAFGIG